MTLCKDCLHFQAYKHTQDDGDCRHPQVTWIHPVSGSKRYGSAFITRKMGDCGPNGSLWTYDPGSPPEPDEQEDLG
jgi:hypothetical protein